jgi:hypothetical protein
VVACLLVMIFFTVIFTVSSQEKEMLAARELGWISLAVAIIAGIAIIRVIRPQSAVVQGPPIEELEAQGLVDTTEYTASRAIMVEEFDDEGLFYLLDIGEGKTVCLTGQELYDFEPLNTKEDGEDRPRRFPNTQFNVLRHRSQGYILDLQCRGEPFEPLQIFPHFTPKDFKRDVVPEDSQIIRDFTFDELIANKGRLPRSLSHA